MIPPITRIENPPQILKGKISQTHQGLGYRWMCRYDFGISKLGSHESLWSRKVFGSWKEAVRDHQKTCACGIRKKQSATQRDQPDHKRFLSLPYVGGSHPFLSPSEDRVRQRAEQIRNLLLSEFSPSHQDSEGCLFRTHWGIETLSVKIRKAVMILRHDKVQKWPDMRTPHQMLPPQLQTVVDQILPVSLFEDFVSRKAPSGILFFQEVLSNFIQYLRYEIQSGVLYSPAQETLWLIARGEFPIGFLDNKLLLLS